ncbi:hypothetical protein RUM44_002727 [Polyplax serrata]|uniref:alanine--tRNA ligase n=1 Tax=Polyplax serrata TaxID=468196 RepID=A0ABR1AFJ9_POLSC
MSMAQMRASERANELSSSKIRNSFIDFFCEDNRHHHIRSSPVFSLFDPTLAFVNAGMNQFKDIFLGKAEPAFKRVANSQKCIRVGGKHNDLCQVGKDGTHHSFFEMLGNWSFGDYFKKEACCMAWNLLTKVYRLPPERFYVTYFGGDYNLGLEPDLEVREIWRDIGVKTSHILPFGVENNFWEMGISGPCGPCTEIHYDHMPGRRDAGAVVNSGSPDLSELWNLVFTQYNRKQDGSLEKLGNHFVDTGMGFERLVSVLQGKKSNYDTDLFMPIFEAIKNQTGHSGYTGQYGNNEIDTAYRLLADHGRMVTVALTDGMLPNHHYKVRTIIRRALAVCEDAFRSDVRLLKEVINCVADTLSEAYPNIERNVSQAHYVLDGEVEILKHQKKNVRKLWKKINGKYPTVTEVDLLEEPKLIEGIEYIKQADVKSKTLTAENAWVLFDRLGINEETIQKIAATLGLTFDASEFEQFKETVKCKNRSDAEVKLQTSFTGRLTQDTLDQLKKMQLQPTKDDFQYSYRFDTTGKYKFQSQEATIQAILRDNKIVDSLSSDMAKGVEIGLVLDRSQLLCEERNRESDLGVFVIENEIVFRVTRIAKVNGLAIHYGSFQHFPSTNTVVVNNIGLLEVNTEKRTKLMRNHTALNLLKAAVRRVINISCEKASKVTADKVSLLFMTYKDKIHISEIERMEVFVRDLIRSDVSVVRKPLSLQQFYGTEDIVFVPGNRLVESEIPVVEVNSGFTVIKEHCTGAHVLRTSHLEDFVITNFKKSCNGFKKVEAITGRNDVAAVREADFRFEEKWKVLRDEIKAIPRVDFIQVKMLKDKYYDFWKEVTASSGLSYVTKHKLLDEMEKSESKIKSWFLQAMRASAEKEMKEYLSSISESVVVYRLQISPAAMNALNAASTVCQGRPCLLFARDANVVNVLCQIPETLTCEKLTARQWLTAALEGEINTSTWKMTEISKFRCALTGKNVSEEQLARAMAKARETADKKSLK